MAPLASATPFGRYRLSSRIATGGMAEVFLGRRVGEDGEVSAVAIKRLLPHLVKDPSLVRMFVNEARITAQIQHPNVVKIVEVGVVDGEPFIAMELLEGHSFAELRSRAAHRGLRVPLGITVRVLSEACQGLDAAHRAVDEEGRQLCIVHRDFTPDNIHVGFNGEVRVIDFGIAKSAGISAGTEPGTLKGKFFYMSPEMIAGRPVDHRADIFAAGVMLYEQLCGHRPFTGLDSEEVVRRIVAGNPRRPSEFDPSVPPALEAICLRAMATEPGGRYSSIAELIAGIGQVGGAAEVASAQEVGSYVSELFPVEEDLERQALRKALQDGPVLDRALPDGPTRVNPRLVAARSAGRGWRWPIRFPRPMVLGAAVAGLGALAAILWLGAHWAASSHRSPGERLAAAQRVAGAEQRAHWLLPLAKDETARPDDLSDAGNLLLGASADEAALELAETFATRFPKDVRAHLLCARAATRLHRGKRADAALERAEALAPSDVRADLVRAELRQVQGDLSGALEALARARQKSPSSLEVAARYGKLLSQAGNLDESAEVLLQVLQHKFVPEVAAELGFVRFRQGQLQAASALLKRAQRRDPRLFEAHYYLGAVLFRQGDLEGAEREYREADALAPGDSRALLALCQLESRSANPGAAKTTAELLAKRFPGSPELKVQCAP